MAAKVQYDASFTADTTTAEQNVKRYAAQISAANKTLQEAERSAKQSYQQQMIAAKAAGVGTEALNKITQQYNQSLYSIGRTAQEVGSAIVDANRNATSTAEAQAQAVELVNKELQVQIAATNELAAANAKNNHEAVSGVQATSAAIRGLEGSGGIRAVENFISKTLGLGPAMQMVFPLIGAAMFGKMIYDVGEKIYDVEQKAAHAAETTRAWMDDSHSKAQVTITDLTIQGDKLEENIAKLSGHPGNGLKTALDEATKYSQGLNRSLIANNKELAELFKKNSVGVFASALSGVAATGKQEKELLQDRSDLAKEIGGINTTFNQKTAAAKTTDEIKSLGEQRDKAVRDAVTRSIQNAAKERKRLSDEYEKSPDVQIARDLDRRGIKHAALKNPNSARIANIDADNGQLQDMLDTQAVQKRVTDLTEKEGATKQAKEEDEARKRAAHAGNSAANAALAAAKQAQEVQRQNWDEQMRIAKNGGQFTAEAEATAWNDLANTVVKGSANYVYASNKALEATAKANADHRKLIEEGIKMHGEFAGVQRKQVLGALAPGMAADAKGVQDQQTSLRALLDAQRESVYQQALAQASLDASTGKISRYDAAVQVQTLHSREYAAQLADLQEALAAVDGQDNESIAKRNGINKQITELTQRQQIDGMRDTAAVAAETWQGALKNTNAIWVADSRNAAKQVTDLYSSVMSGVNGNIVNAMTGERTSWGSTFRGIGKQVAGIGLQRAESGLLSKFGLGGKADGSKTNPLYVRNADGSVSATSGSSAASGLAHSALSAALGFIPGFGSLASAFVGGFADGGYMPPGIALVGERGPELIRSTGAHVTPNHQLGNALGSTAYYSIHMDGGVTSEQMHQQMTALLRQNHSQVVRDSVHAMSERMARRPASAR